MSFALSAFTPAAVHAAVAGDRSPIAFAENAADVWTMISEVAKAYDALLARTGARAPWIGYLATDANRIVGTCGFKDGVRDGMVEIAYFTFPDFERRGYGKAMARALIEIAWANGGPKEIWAHTLPQENPSTSILRGLKFAFAGPVKHPEDGLIWRWTLQRDPA